MSQVNVVFNCDRTLTSIEGPVELAKKMKVQGIDTLTEQAMNGTVSFEEVFRQRFELARPSLKDLLWLSKQYLANITEGAKEAISELTNEGHSVFIVSAGYRTAIVVLAQELGIPALNVCAVDIRFDTSGQFVSYDVGNILTTDQGLEIVLAEIAKRGPTVYVGDSVRDMDARRVADLVIGYGGAVARPKVEEMADVYITAPSLLPMVQHVQTFAASIETEGMSERLTALHH